MLALQCNKEKGEAKKGQSDNQSVFKGLHFVIIMNLSKDEKSRKRSSERRG
jgi:hypothetical protein